MTHLHIDFETRSTVELKSAGAHAYAEHQDTDVWCLAWSAGGADVQLWTPESTSFEFLEHVERGAVVYAHNASFELAIWNRLMVPRYGWPQLDPAQVRCTMAMAYAMALPGALDDAAAAVGLPIGKDLEGKRLMLQMARPRLARDNEEIVWWDDEARRERLYAYCRQDVEVERQLAKRLLALIDSEQELWVLDQLINDRGVAVDLRVINKLLRAVESEKSRLDREMQRVTRGAVRSCNQVAALEAWAGARGVPAASLAKADLAALLAAVDLPADVREALRLRQLAAKSSVAKLKAMRAAACADGRVRGTLQYHAASTGRWGGRRIQPQNFPRPSLGQDEIERVVAMFGGVR